MNASSRHVRGNQRRDAVRLEPSERAVPLWLGKATMDRRGVDAGGRQLFGQPICAVPGAGEHDRRSPCADDLRGTSRPFGTIELLEVVVDLRLLVRVGEFVGDRVLLVVALQDGDVAIERRGEQNGLTRRRALVEEASNLRKESHVGHAIGLIDDDDPDVIQPQRPLVQEVTEPTRTRHENLDAAAERRTLRFVPDTAIHRGYAEVACFREGAEG